MNLYYNYKKKFIIKRGVFVPPGSKHLEIPNFEVEIKKYYTNLQIFNIFKSNKRILLFLYDEQIIIFDKCNTKKISQIEKFKELKNLRRKLFFRFPHCRDGFWNDYFLNLNNPDFVSRIFIQR